MRFKNELERNITIKLGYANAKVRFRPGSAFLRSKSDSINARSTNAPTQSARGLDPTGLIRQPKKQSLSARCQDAGTR